MRANELQSRPCLHKGGNGTLCTGAIPGGGLRNIGYPLETAELLGGISCYPSDPRLWPVPAFPLLGFLELSHCFRRLFTAPLVEAIAHPV